MQWGYKIKYIFYFYINNKIFFVKLFYYLIIYIKTMANNTSHFVRLGLIVVGAVLLFYLISSYNNSKNSGVNTAESFYAEVPEQESKQVQDQTHEDNSIPSTDLQHNATTNTNDLQNVPKASDMNNEIYGSIDLKGNSNGAALPGNQFPKDCYPKDQLTPKELLPTDSNSKWAQVNPSGQGSLKDGNFLNAGHHMGTNTVGQSLRNANLSIRSEPPNPQVKVSPWMQTTIEPDTNRKAMEIGGCQ
jgi:hypothetical protein